MTMVMAHWHVKDAKLGFTQAGHDPIFHYKTSVVGQYFKDKSECFTNALIKGVNQAVIECFEAEPVQDYKVYHA